MADQPQVTITALGNSGSGKTTFLLGMYGIMSGGLRGYFLNAPDPDADLRLSAMWERFLDDGVLPPPNQGDATPYSFMFSDGIKPLLLIDWLDYRGGALDDETGAESGDVPRLHEQLRKSDSIYLVLDGQYLAEPVDGSTKLGIMRRAGLRRMTNLLQATVQAKNADGAPLPSLVVLITKSDLISGLRSQRERVVEDVRELLSLCFADGLSTLVCPIQLGDLGIPAGDKVDAATIEPRSLHMPIIFSLAEYMRGLSEAAGSAAASSSIKQQQLTAELGNLRSGAGKYFRRGVLRAKQGQLANVAEEQEAMTRIRGQASERAQSLFDELNDQPVFRDGIQVAL